MLVKRLLLLGLLWLWTASVLQANKLTALVMGPCIKIPVWFVRPWLGNWSGLCLASVPGPGDPNLRATRAEGVEGTLMTLPASCLAYL